MLTLGFFKKNGKMDVLVILRRFDLDEFAIEAKAIRQAWPDLDLADKMQTSLRSRFDRTLRRRRLSGQPCKADAAKFGTNLNNDEVPRLADFAGKEPA